MRLCKNNVFSFSKERSSVNFLKFSSVYCESFLKNPSTKQIECVSLATAKVITSGYPEKPRFYTYLYNGNRYK